MSLFGAAPAATQLKANLFGNLGSTNNTTANPQPNSNPFGGLSNSQQQSSSLFGDRSTLPNAPAPQQQGYNLFGASQNQQQQVNSLFANTQNQQAGNSLFGNTNQSAPQQAPQQLAGFGQSQSSRIWNEQDLPRMWNTHDPLR